MTTEERQQSLTNARKAAEWLKGYLKGFSHEPFEQEVAALLKGFDILDTKEKKQAKQGKHGVKGGRPKKTKNGGKK